MRPDQILKTIYLGDRACKAIRLEGFSRRVLIQVDEISRVRSASGLWEFYNDENIVDGFLVFTDVKEIKFDPSGPLPNDYINQIQVEPTDDGSDSYIFSLSISSINETAESVEVQVTIICTGFHLLDPARPNLIIE